MLPWRCGPVWVSVLHQRTMGEWNELQMRSHGEAERPTLIYLPGLHGDWTLVSSFRGALGNRVRFVEFTYPRTVTWSLEDHARAVLDKLAGRPAGG